VLAWVMRRRGAGRLWGSGVGSDDADTYRLAYAAHHCTSRPVRPPLLGWCAVCGRVRVRGLRPAGPPRPRAWVHTWVCAAGCRRSAGTSAVVMRPLRLLVAAGRALLVAYWWPLGSLRRMPALSRPGWDWPVLAGEEQERLRHWAGRILAGDSLDEVVGDREWRRPSGRLGAARDQAGAWDARPCPQAPARQAQPGQARPEQPGGPA
jgi:hypothetical protein